MPPEISKGKRTNVRLAFGGLCPVQRPQKSLDTEAIGLTHVHSSLVAQVLFLQREKKNQTAGEFTNIWLSCNK